MGLDFLNGGVSLALVVRKAVYLLFMVWFVFVFTLRGISEPLGHF